MRCADGSAASGTRVPPCRSPADSDHTPRLRLQARRLVLSTLRRQRFGRALRHVVEGPTRTALRKAGLELAYILRDMAGRSLLRMQDTPAGTILQLTPAGIEAASVMTKSARGKRQRGS